VFKKVIVTLLGLFGARPAVIRRPGNCAPLRYAPGCGQPKKGRGWHSACNEISRVMGALAQTSQPNSLITLSSTSAITS